MRSSDLDDASRVLTAKDEHVPNATYAEPPTEEEQRANWVSRLYDFMEAEGEPIHVIGQHGIGKTTGWKAEAAARNHRVVYWNMANRTPEDNAVPMPRMERIGEEDFAVLDFLLDHQLEKGDRFILLMDEPWRAMKQVDNQSLEVVQNKMLAGRKLNLIGIVALNNESAMEGFRSGRKPDLPWADRWTTVKVTEHQIPWRRALAAKYPTWDLKDLFAARDALDSAARFTVAPRTLDHMITVATNGLPMGLALPIMGKRVTVHDNTGNDRTEEVLKSFSAALGVPYRDHTARTPDLLQRVRDLAVQHGWTVYCEGPHGIGKTAWWLDELSKLGLEVGYFSMPNASPESFSVPFPFTDPETGQTHLRQMVHKVFASPNRKAILVDECWRTDPQTRNKEMELLQEKSVAGIPVPNLVCTIALNNPPEVAGYKFDVGTPDFAQADRFDISIQVGPDDVPANEHLIRTYGADAEPFLEWHQEDLDDLGRVLITKRTIERMVKLHRNGFDDLEIAKAYIPGDEDTAGYVGPPLQELYARLANRPLARIRRIVANVEQYESWLAEHLKPGAAGQIPFKERHGEVRTAFARAELPQLEEHYDAVVRLMAVLHPNLKVTLFRGVGKDRQTFWLKVLQDVKARTDAAAG